MKVYSLVDYDPEECKYPEDGYFADENSLFAVVADGCSEYYSGESFRYPYGKSGGRVVADITTHAFMFARPDDSLESVGLRANEAIWRVQQQHRGQAVSRADAATLANNSFACIKLDRESGGFEALWGADCFIIWKAKSGKVSIVGGDNREADLQRERIYAETPNKKDYWLKEFPRLKREQDNVLYAVLNGQPQVQYLWRKEVVQKPVELIVLLTDGDWIPMERWEENSAMAEEFVHQLEQGGLQKALQWVRGTQNEGLTSKRVARPEATMVVIYPD